MGEVIRVGWLGEGPRGNGQVIPMQTVRPIPQPSPMRRAVDRIASYLSPEKARVAGMTRATTSLIAWTDQTVADVDGEFAIEQLEAAIKSVRSRLRSDAADQSPR